jgi:transcriptional regulator with XRE-family HTH domain
MYSDSGRPGHLNNRTGIPALPFCHVTLTAAKTRSYDPLTISEHIKKARIDRGLTQSNAVAFLSVSVETLHNWETGKTAPVVKYWPAIMEFLGYCPYQRARSLGDRLRLHRMHQGLTLEDLAEILEVDPGSVSSWETGERPPREEYLEMIAKFLGVPR